MAYGFLDEVLAVLVLGGAPDLLAGADVACGRSALPSTPASPAALAHVAEIVGVPIGSDIVGVPLSDPVLEPGAGLRQRPRRIAGLGSPPRSDAIGILSQRKNLRGNGNGVV